MANLFTDSFFRKQMGKIRAELGTDEAQIEKYKETVQKRIAYVNDFNPETDSEEKDWPGFERDVFHDLLGYKIKDDDPPDYHLFRQSKVKGAGKHGGTGKTDCTLGFYSKNKQRDGNDPVIVEFKAPDTPNLDEAADQLWNYMTRHEKCRWGIVSNFNEITLYHRNRERDRKQTFYFTVSEDENDRKFPLIRYMREDEDEKAIEFTGTDKDGKKYDYSELIKFLAIFRKDRLICEQGESVTDRMLSLQGIEEKKIEKEFYEKYYRLRIDLFNEIAEYNPPYRKKREELVSVTQKILDRLIFIWFCEDSREELLPRNILQRLIGGLMKKSPDMRSENDVWDEIRKLFKAVDDGKGFSIGSGYNGELFKPDLRIDDLVIPNRIFEQQVKPIGEEYDFGHEKELSVNILGHIFEQSISDLEELKQGQPADKKTGKRKREGVYYTPEYITRYIVKQALGGWLAERRKELGEENLPKLTDQLKKKSPKRGGKPGVRKPKITEKMKKDLYTATGNEELINRFAFLKTSFKDEAELRQALATIPEAEQYTDMIVEMAMPEDADLENWYILEKYWRNYREVLKNVKVLDPACGSGAFLIQAFDFLHEEGEKVNQAMENLGLGNENIFDLDRQILENNLHGVDINDESVEITKLSLWLKTAVKHKKLNNLFNNIKCGNSLVDDPKVAGKKAFKWEKEFPEIMKNGGFDVVIGNPPYVRQELLTPYKPYFSEKYQCSSGTADLYVYFYEKGIEIMKSEGILCYISSNKFIRSNYGIHLRLYLQNYQIDKIVDFGELPVFQDASTFPVIMILKKIPRKNQLTFCQIRNLEFASLSEIIKNESAKIPVTSLHGSSWSFSEHNEKRIMDKIDKAGIPLEEYVEGNIRFGIKTGYNEAFIIQKNQRDEIIDNNPKSDKIIKPFLDGNDVRKYYYDFKDKYLIFLQKGWTKEHCDKNVDEIIGWKYIKDNYPEIANHLIKYEKKAKERQDKGDFWWELRACDYYKDFNKSKILYPDIALESRFTIDSEGYYPNATLFEIPKNDKYLLTLLNSKTIWFYLSNKCPVIGDVKKRGRLRLKTVYLKALPICISPVESQKIFIEKADTMLNLNRQLSEQKQSLNEYLTVSHNLDSFPQKLRHPENLDFADFIKELKKKKVNTDESSIFESLKNYHSNIKELRNRT